MDYGIANASGKPSLQRATELIHFSWAQGIRCYDTAQSYGASEAVLGNALAACDAASPQIVSKLSPGTDIDDVDAVVRSVSASLQRLRVGALWGLLLHDEDALDAWGAGKARGLDAVKRMGLVQHLGVSVYTCERALHALDLKEVDILQVPANVFDRRMLRSGVFACAEERNKTVFVRSVFLQGLIFLPLGDKRLNLVPSATDAARALRQFCSDRKLALRQFAIDHVKWMSPAASIIIGAEAISQVAENLNMIRSRVNDSAVHQEWEDVWTVDHLDLLDPRRWPKV